VLWSEWNGKYRDTVRQFWKGDGGVVSDFATRFCGSSDLYEWSSRRPHASLNFVTCHDGFTLNDLVSYDHKHNEANGEENRDGSDNNISWNCGVEGPSDDPQIVALREKKKRSLLATLLLSQGVPMLLAGDERGQSQKGNNNAYCQDNAIAWIDWETTPDEEKLVFFTRQVIEVFHQQPVFHRRRFFHGHAIQGAEAPEIAWLEPTGKEMASEDWKSGFARCLGVQLFGGEIDVDEHGEAIIGDSMLLLFNADHSHCIPFTLPVPKDTGPWELVFDTARYPLPDPPPPGAVYDLEPCSMAVFRSAVPRPAATV